MPNFRIDNIAVDNPTTGESQQRLAHAHKKKQRVYCLCTEPNPELYIATVNGTYFVKRMPETGHTHHPECDHYAPRENIGKGVMGDAIRENLETGEVSLRLGFSLSITLESSRMPKTGEPKKEREATKSRDTAASTQQIGITGLLHFLYEEAQFNKWSPKMRGKRSWWVVATHLRTALEGKIGKGEPLAAHTLIPRDNNTDEQTAFNKWHKQLMPGGKKKAPVGIVIGELKDIKEGKFSMQIELEHLPGRYIFAPEKVIDRFHKSFEMEFDQRDMGARLIFIGAVYLNKSGAMLFDRAGVLAVDHGTWLPMSDFYGNQLITQAVNLDRRFYVPMRYELDGMMLPTLTLTDTDIPTSILTQSGENDDIYVEEDVTTIMWNPENERFTMPPKAEWHPRPSAKPNQTETEHEEYADGAA